jgi:hypothetical protein
MKGSCPQYLFCHQPNAESSQPQSDTSRETPQQQTDPGQEEYIYISRPHGGTTKEESPDRAVPALVPGKKIVRTTREEIRDLGDGQTQTVRETSEELVDDNEGKTSVVPPDVIPVQSTPVVHADNVDTWKSTASTDSGDRNIFNKFRFKFDSIGNFGRCDSRDSTASSEALRFQDFDDMVGHISHLKVPVATNRPKHLTDPTGSTCPYCKNNNPGNIVYISLSLNGHRL